MIKIKKMKILVFDNYDSFTYNLVHLVEKILHTKVSVFRNDEISLEDVAAFDKIILSPGPGVPLEAGLLVPLIQAYASSKSILGVCLGHQAIAEAFGGSLINLDTVFHGVATPVNILSTSNVLFQGLPPTIEVGRYHSWIVDEDTLPGTLEITARDNNNYIMALSHREYDVQSVQFHPESIMTPNGEAIIRNWLNSRH
jgi:anthranilate synthase component II